MSSLAFFRNMNAKEKQLRLSFREFSTKKILFLLDIKAYDYEVLVTTMLLAF